MVQGTTKGLRAKAINNVRHSHKAAANTKKGRRVAPPKKTAAIKQASMHKVSPCYCTAALIPIFLFPFYRSQSQSHLNPCSVPRSLFSHTEETELSFGIRHSAPR